MPSINAFEINGVVDTSQTVLNNLNTLATASGCWVTYDVSTGLWSVIINRAGASVKSFNDSNIIGGINVSGSGINESYNKVTVEFPHKDLRDQIDYIDLAIPEADRFENEEDNTLNIQLNIVNDPVQAQYIAAVELKQSRVDKVIDFRTDYSALGIRAGDLIDVTASAYGFSSKVFRVIKLSEIDSDDGNIELQITALEYDANVYNSSGLIRSERTKKTGILPKITNDTLQNIDDQAAGVDLERLLLTTAATGLLNYALSRNPLTGKITQSITATDAKRDAVLSKIKEPDVSIAGPSSICEGNTLTLVVSTDCDCLLDTSAYEFSYTITGVQAADITPFPLTGKTKVGLIQIPIIQDASSESETLVFTIGNASKSVTLLDKLTYTYNCTISATSVTEGGSLTATLTTTGISDGTSIPYQLSSNAGGRITTPLTGNVTVNSNQATLTITTVDDAIYQGNASISLTFDPSASDPCNQLNNSLNFTVLDNDTPPPPPPADTTCEYVSVPMVWCGVFDGTDNQMKSVSVRQYAMLPKPLAGEATVTVPLTLTVTKGNPSTITVATTTTVASSSSLGGSPIQIITAFNTVAPKGLITGSATTTVYGYF